MSWLMNRINAVRSRNSDAAVAEPAPASRAHRAATAAAALRRTAADLEAQEAVIARKELHCRQTAACLRDAGDTGGGVFQLQRATQHTARLVTLRAHLLGVDRALHQLESCASTRAVCDELENCARALKAVAPEDEAIEDVLDMLDAGSHDAAELLGACATETVQGRDWDEELRLLPRSTPADSSERRRGGSGSAGAVSVHAWPRAPTAAPEPRPNRGPERQPELESSTGTRSRTRRAPGGDAGAVLRRLESATTRRQTGMPTTGR
jgi:hypothetical protein